MRKLSYAIASTVLVSSFVLLGCGPKADELLLNARTAQEQGVSETQVLDLYEQAAKAGSAEASRYLADYYLTRKDYLNAVSHYLAIEKAYPVDFYYNMGRLYLKGDGIQQDVDKGIELLNKAIVEGESLAAFELGEYYEEQQQFEKAEEFYKKSVASNDVRANLNYAKLILNKRLPNQEPKVATNLLKSIAASDENNVAHDINYEARLLLAQCYVKGLGVDQSYLQADVLARKLLNQRAYKTRAQVVLAEIKLRGIDSNAKNEGLNELTTIVTNTANPDAAMLLYKVYRKGLYGYERNIKKALHYARIAQASGSYKADIALAEMYYDGIGIEQNFSESARYIKNAYEKDPFNAEVLYWYGRMYAEGIGVYRNDDEGFKYLEQATKLGHKQADLQRLFMMSSGRAPSGTESDAIKQFKTHADDGNAQAQFKYGTALLEGIVVAKDLDGAIKYLSLATTGGETDAYYYLASAYSQKQDYKNAITCYEKSIENDKKNAASSYANLGEIYSMQKDTNKAIEAYKKASELGHDNAALNLARIYYTEEKFNLARDIFEKYENKPQAQVFLGMMYHFGKGYVANEIQALDWYDKAIQGGNTDAMFLEAVLIREGKQIPDDYFSKPEGLLYKAACAKNEEAMLYLAQDFYKNEPNQAIGWLEYAKKYTGSSAAQYLIGKKYSDVNGEERLRYLQKVESQCL